MPYSAELASEAAALPDGTRLALRPIQPEDEPLLQDIVRHMLPEDLRMRFFTPMKGLSHQLAERLTHLDAAHEAALIALTAEDGTALGAARLAGDHDNRRAEFAIGVRSDWHRRGLGRLLIGRMIDLARARGVGELFGDVLHENEPMLRLCHAMGFELASNPDDATLVRASKRLG